MTQVCPAKVLVFLFDQYITHQELYASAGSREGQNGGEVGGRAFRETPESSLP